MYNENEKSKHNLNEVEEVSQNSYFTYLEEISRYKLLSQEEELQLFQKIQNGDKVAKELFVKSNLRLVVKEAKKYFSPGYNDLLDLIQEGNIGLLKAIEQYEPLKGCKFSTYAVYHIDKAIQVASSRTGAPLELPGNKLALIRKIKAFINKTETETGRGPSYNDIAKNLNVSISAIKEIMPFVLPAVSFQSKIKENEDDREVLDVFSEYYEYEPSDVEKSFIINETREEFRKIIINVLNKKEIYILCSRRGLFGAPVKDVKTLAEELSMSLQGVRQCEERTLVKLRKHFAANNQSFSSFVEG